MTTATAQPPSPPPQRHSRFSFLVFSIKQAIRQATLNKGEYLLASSSILLVVTTVCIIITESTVGELDLIINSGGNGLNSSVIPTDWLFSDRIQFSTSLYNADRCINSSITNTNTLYNDYITTACEISQSLCLAARCGMGSKVNAYAINTTQERRLGIGRRWSWDIPDDAIFIQNDVARALGVTEGDEVVMSVRLRDIMSSVQSDEERLIRSRVERVIFEVYGKASSEERASIWFNIDTIRKILPTDDTATHVVFVCSEDRIQCYLDVYDVISKQLLEWSSNIVYQLGFNVLDTEMPVLKQLSTTLLFSSFLNLIFTLVILLLGGLSVFLIYSLLMVSVEVRIYELGIMRMVGMTKLRLMTVILTQALGYGIPASVLGLALSQLCWIFLKSFLAQLLSAQIGSFITPGAVLSGLLIGLVVPLAASILPITRALSQNLHDSIDQRPKTKAVVITTERTRMRFDVNLLVTGVLLAVFGFIIYYFLPLALVYQNFGLLFNIFLLLLVGMLLGLVLLSVNLESLVSSLFINVVFFLLFTESKSLPLLVKKNLIAHKLRNRKTFVMYSLSLGFILFLTTGIRIELESLIFNQRRLVGAPIQLQFNSADMIRLARIEDILYETSEYSYMSAEYTALVSGSATSLSNLGRIESAPVRAFALSPNFYDVIETKYLIYDRRIDLYSVKGCYSVTLGSQFKPLFNVELDDVILFNAQLTSPTRVVTNKRDEVMANSFLDLSIMRVSKFPSTRQDIGMSMHLMGNLTGVHSSIIPLFRIYIHPTVPVQVVLDKLKVVAAEESITYVEDVLGPIYYAQNTLNWLFQLITIITLCIAFFSLNSSMVTNIQEQQREIGILLSLGLSKYRLYRLYFYEAFFLILSASVMGFIIGVFVGWSMSLQRSVVTQLPIQFIVPWDLFGIIVGVCVLCALISTWFPIYRVVQRRIVKLLK